MKKKIPFQTRRQIHNQYKSYNILKLKIMSCKSVIEDAIDLLALNLKLGIQNWFIDMHREIPKLHQNPWFQAPTCVWSKTQYLKFQACLVE